MAKKGIVDFFAEGMGLAEPIPVEQYILRTHDSQSGGLVRGQLPNFVGVSMEIEGTKYDAPLYRATQERHFKTAILRDGTQQVTYFFTGVTFSATPGLPRSPGHAPYSTAYIDFESYQKVDGPVYAFVGPSKRAASR